MKKGVQFRFASHVFALGFSLSAFGCLLAAYSLRLVPVFIIKT